MEIPAAGAGVVPTQTSKETQTCLYPSKRCENPRGVKRNGELHNFCDVHRNKANFNQRCLEHKRKYQREAAPPAISLPPELLQSIPAPLPALPPLDNAISSDELPSTTLEPEDIWILQELLKADNEQADGGQFP
ncbi:hypothetical protein PHYPSEUDO_007109 [Phytophthora pseudosyringae]|uniref:Uncharacterized protein n=1 Tax=Phytophthora pseudosyringae TaxID=221518 RepID=A0A8T1WAL1_9STRA|nr:hypothetical protein PHYPSEUDO_007109 [Phytophthora pseudosyringae]